MSKQMLAALCATAAATAIAGFGFGAATRPQSADAATSNADVVRQLKVVDKHIVQVSRQLGAANDKLGASQTSQGSVRGLLTLICNYTASVDCG